MIIDCTDHEKFRDCFPTGWHDDFYVDCVTTYRTAPYDYVFRVWMAEDSAIEKAPLWEYKGKYSLIYTYTTNGRHLVGSEILNDPAYRKFKLLFDKLWNEQLRVMGHKYAVHDTTPVCVVSRPCLKRGEYGDHEYWGECYD